jgi:glycosyltransferase involved in cell wall biosynthesis
MIFTLLKGLSKDQSVKVIAVVFNDGTVSKSLVGSGVETIIIDESRQSFRQMLTTAHNTLQCKGVQLIHSHGYKANLLAWLLARSIGVRKLVSTVHSLPERVFSESVVSRVGSKMKMAADTRLLRHRFSRVVTVSQDIKNVFQSRHAFPDPMVELIYNGIEIDPEMVLTPHSPGDGPVHIGTVGRMVPVKDFRLFLEIAAELRRHNDNIRFSILGDGPMKEELVKGATKLGLEGCLTFETPRPDPLPYYRSLDIYLNTSLHEGLPLSLLEAMACGKPVVAPNVGGIPELLGQGEHGFLVSSRRAQDFSEPCLRLIQDRNLRLRLGKNAAQRVAQSFNSIEMTKAYRDLYTRLMS